MTQVVFQKLCNLIEVDILYNSVVKDISCLQSLSHIKILSIRGCYELWRQQVLGIFQSLQSLKSLDIAECCQLKEKGIIRIAKRYCHLEIYNVRDTSSVSYNSILQVEDVLIYLQEFKFCPVIHRHNSSIWIPIYLKYPKLQICPAAVEIILELNPDVFQ